MTVLVVEDNVYLLQVIADIVEIAGYQVTTAGSGEEALRQLEQLDDLQLVITDYQLPDHDGHELCLTIHRRFPQCKGLIMSGYERGPAVEAIKHNSFLSFLPKPFGYPELNERMTSLIGN
ncbi:MAG TPA: response regulator [Candidatus Sulfomarinibacteraceae bacterium]|nr:response regulator [Candidatus Sulfomarinibacteraceae bacterium]